MNAAVQEVIRCAREAFNASGARPRGSNAVGARIFAALEVPGTDARETQPGQLPACAHLDRAIDNGRRGGMETAALAHAFAAIAPELDWHRRAGASPDQQPFFDGHANSMLAGPKGLERRGDVLVGVSLIAPDVTYIDHSHPPEEIYVVISPGEWRQNAEPWQARAPGDVVHNPPGILHAMRAGPEPLLALWLLWLRERG